MAPTASSRSSAATPPRSRRQASPICASSAPSPAVKPSHLRHRPHGRLAIGTRISLLTLSGFKLRLEHILGTDVDLSCTDWMKEAIRVHALQDAVSLS